MPALQVRDFPQGLYDRLQAQAKLEHRSIAQQTIASVERDLNRVEEGGAEILTMSSYQNTHKRDAETVEQRIARRKRVLAEIHEHNLLHPLKPGAPSALEMVRQSREEAYARLGR